MWPRTAKAHPTIRLHLQQLSVRDLEVFSPQIVPFEIFARVIREYGAKLTHEQLVAVAQRFAARGATMDQVRRALASKAEESSSNALRSRELMASWGSVRGSRTDDLVLDDWMASSGTGRTGFPPPRDVDSKMDALGPWVDFPAFVKRMAELLTSLMRRDGGPGDVDGGGVLGSVGGSWALREFELVDSLLVQLQAMTTADRRRSIHCLRFKPHTACRSMTKSPSLLARVGV